MKLQTLLNHVYPPQCLMCDALLQEPNGLCGPCWRDTPFLTGLVCDQCGAPLPGRDEGRAELCDDCLTIARPWDHGRAALLYRDGARRLVLALKHGDRQDLALPAAQWMARAAAPIMLPDAVIVPVPIHRFRLLRRRYNQAALLANRLGPLLSLPVVPDALIRCRNTGDQDGKNREARFRNVAGAMAPHPRRASKLSGRPVLLVDDVMTSGATFAAAAEACHAAGATRISVLSLARVAKGD